jgi:hypothetical protein
MSYCSDKTLEADSSDVEGLQVETFDCVYEIGTEGGSDRYRSRKRQQFQQSQDFPPLHWNTWRDAGIEETKVAQADRNLLDSLDTLLYTFFGRFYAQFTPNEMEAVYTALTAGPEGDFWLNPARNKSSVLQDTCEREIRLKIGTFLYNFGLSYPGSTSSITFDGLKLEMGKLDLAIEHESKVKLACVQWCASYNIFQHQGAMPIKFTMVCGMYLKKTVSVPPSTIPGPQPTLRSSRSGLTALTSAALMTVPSEPAWGALHRSIGQPEVHSGNPFDHSSVYTETRQNHQSVHSDDTLSGGGIDTPPSTAAPSEAGGDDPPPAYQS